MTSPAVPSRFLIGPGALDCNRGDQALLWEAVATLRRIDTQAEIAILSEGHADPDDVQSRQSRALGLRVLPPFMDNPRRVLGDQDRSIMDGRRAVWCMAGQAVLDFLYSLILLICYPQPCLIHRLLSRQRRQTYDYLRTCNALVIKGGGYLYAHKGPKWLYFLWFGLLPLMLAQRIGIKTLILPNSLGPFASRTARSLARRVLGRCDLLTVREPHSARTLESLLPRKPYVYPDMAFGLKAADPAWARQTLQACGVPLERGRCVGMTLRPWRFPTARHPQTQYRRYLQAHVEFIHYLLAQDYEPVLFVHSQGPHAHEDDRMALQAVKDQLGEDIAVSWVDGDFTCRQLKALYGYMHAMVCTRFHSAVFSLAQQVPCLAISYQGTKAGGIMQEAGLSDFVLDIESVTAPALIERFEQMQRQRDRIQARLRDYGNACTEGLHELDQAVRSALI